MAPILNKMTVLEAWRRFLPMLKIIGSKKVHFDDCCSNVEKYTITQWCLLCIIMVIKVYIAHCIWPSLITNACIIKHIKIIYSYKSRCKENRY